MLQREDSTTGKRHREQMHKSRRSEASCRSLCHLTPLVVSLSCSLSSSFSLFSSFFVPSLFRILLSPSNANRRISQTYLCMANKWPLCPALSPWKLYIALFEVTNCHCVLIFRSCDSSHFVDLNFIVTVFYQILFNTEK